MKQRDKIGIVLALLVLACSPLLVMSQPPATPATPEHRLRIVIGGIVNENGKPFTDKGPMTLARIAAGIVGGATGADAVSETPANNYMQALEHLRGSVKTWTSTHEANVAGNTATAAAKSKANSEIDLGKSVIPKP